MATGERQEDAGLTEGVVFLSDTGVKLTDVVHWEEEGAQYFRSSEFPFLIAAGDTLQEAANAIVESALDYLREMHEIGLREITEAEREATFALLDRSGASHLKLLVRSIRSTFRFQTARS